MAKSKRKAPEDDADWPSDPKRDLTPKQERFVREYLVDLNATQAAIRAGYSERTAQEQSSRLLSNAMIAQAVANAQQKLAVRLEIKKEQIVDELAKIGFADIRRAVNWRANVTAMVEDPDTGEQRMAVTNEVALIGSHEIDDATAGAISEISQTDRGGLKVKFHDKRGALVDLARMLGYMPDRHEHSGPNGGPIPIASANVTIDARDLKPDQRAALRAALLQIEGGG